MNMIRANSSSVIIEGKKKEITTNVVVNKVDGSKALEFADRIFRKMLISCGAGAAIYKYQDDKNEYILALCDLLIKRRVNSIKAAEAAINELQENRVTYVPGPGEFVSMILRHQIGTGKLPAAEIAYSNACKCLGDKRSIWMHDAIREAAYRTGTHDMLSNMKNDIFPQFKLHYEKVIDELTEGKTFTFISEEIAPMRERTDEEKIASFKGGPSMLKALLKSGRDLTEEEIHSLMIGGVSMMRQNLENSVGADLVS